jgi:hypothetical protein
MSRAREMHNTRSETGSSTQTTADEGLLIDRIEGGLIAQTFIQRGSIVQQPSHTFHVLVGSKFLKRAN